MKKAILFGAGGFIGGFLLEELLNHPDYAEVIIIVRKDLGFRHPKLKTLIGDYHSLHALKEDISGNEIFISIGTTKKNTPDEKACYQIDHDYPVLAASIAKKNGASAIFIVTAVGANTRASLFYIKTKGEVERDITALNFEHTHIFRPSMLLGARKENRPMEKAIQAIWPAVGVLLIGSFSKYRGIQGKDVAKAMINAAQNQVDKLKIYEWREMKALL